jgi:hypothetical protein
MVDKLGDVINSGISQPPIGMSDCQISPLNFWTPSALVYRTPHHQRTHSHYSLRGSVGIGLANLFRALALVFPYNAHTFHTSNIFQYISPVLLLFHSYFLFTFSLIHRNIIPYHLVFILHVSHCVSLSHLP